MPEGMARRRSNTTRWNHHAKRIEWRIHLVFLLRPVESLSTVLRYDFLNGTSRATVFGDSLLSLFCDGISDDQSLHQVIISELNSEAVRNHLAHCSFFIAPQTTSSVKRLLNGMQHEKKKLRCVMQKIPSPGNDPTFFKVCNAGDDFRSHHICLRLIYKLH